LWRTNVADERRGRRSRGGGRVGRDEPGGSECLHVTGQDVRRARRGARLEPDLQAAALGGDRARDDRRARKHGDDRHGEAGHESAAGRRRRRQRPGEAGDVGPGDHEGAGRRAGRRQDLARRPGARRRIPGGCAGRRAPGRRAARRCTRRRARCRGRFDASARRPARARRSRLPRRGGRRVVTRPLPSGGWSALQPAVRATTPTTSPATSRPAVARRIAVRPRSWRVRVDIRHLGSRRSRASGQDRANPTSGMSSRYRGRGMTGSPGSPIETFHPSRSPVCRRRHPASSVPTRCVAISSAHVAAGDGALRTWT